MSATQPLTLLFVMDPIEGEDIDASTTFVFMLEAQKRGHEVLYADPVELRVVEGRAAALATPVTLRRERGDSVTRGTPRLVVLDEDVDVVFQRKDPPVDGAYVEATQILGMCEKALVLNRPRSILAYNEKLFALHFRELMAETIVSHDRGELMAFMEEMGGEMIVKPLDGKGGEGIFHVVKGERNIESIIEQSTGFGAKRAMAQRYLPAVREGDKRILLLEGEPIGAVLRIPADSEVRANLHVGGRAAQATLDPHDEAIVARISGTLREEDLFFVGIDVIGGFLTEVNVTSPTGVQEINTLDGVCLEATIMDRVEARVAARR